MPDAMLQHLHIVPNSPKSRHQADKGAYHHACRSRRAGRAHGVIVSIDDFGTGYSSMSYLRRFPIDKLKIDRSFINDMTKNSDAASIVKAIISRAHGLRLKVVAEGVETAEQLQQLRELGCDQFQGFYRSAAVLPGEIEKFVQLTPEVASLPDQDMFMKTQSELTAFKRR
jgi:EAL domain-containing protein (putative c-di-GMP-specific phosphodiesterase class I)